MAAGSVNSGRFIQTVSGPVLAEQLGFTLPHEHVFVSMWDRRGAEYLYQTEDAEILEAEVRAFKERGGTCLVDQTPRGGGRRPEALRLVSEATGIAIVMGCGWYREPFYPPEDLLERRSVSSLADLIVDEIRGGVGSTGVKPGVIGEIGASQGWVSPLEERVLRAAARAQKNTGLPLGTHALWAAADLHQLEILEDEGADMAKVAIGHCDSQPSLHHCLRLLERGVWVEFDNVGLQLGDHETLVVRLLLDLLDRGYESRILLSHDMGQVPELHIYGGRGLVYLSETFLPRLRAAGVSEGVIVKLTSDNPRAFLSLQS